MQLSEIIYYNDELILSICALLYQFSDGSVSEAWNNCAILTSFILHTGYTHQMMRNTCHVL